MNCAKCLFCRWVTLFMRAFQYLKNRQIIIMNNESFLCSSVLLEISIRIQQLLYIDDELFFVFEQCVIV